MWDELTIDEGVRSVLQRLNRRGYDAFIVGGAVRDLVLERVPKDFDIATSATPSQIKDTFGRSARIIGRRFRLAHVRIGRSCYEVSTFRREPTAEERTSREDDDGVMIWRDNQYGTIEEDAKRRDFTVNALYFSPLESPAYRDFCGGRDDLKAGLVRAIGDPETRLAEDPVRVIRALKLVAEYDFGLAPGLKPALSACSPLIERCSKARLFEELLKILQKPYSVSTLDALNEHGALPAFLPTVAEHWRSESAGQARLVLGERDARLGAGEYSNSRALALASMVYAYACERLNVPAGKLWQFEPGIERCFREIVSEFFAPLVVPRVLTARTRDVLLLLPRFQSNRGRNRLIGHPDYRYARELYSILTTIHGWDPETIAHWPVMGTGHPHGRKPRRRSRRHPRGRRKSPAGTEQ